MNDLIEHAYIHFGTRTIEVLDEEGYSQNVKFEWSEDGGRGFAAMSEFLQQNLESERRTYTF